jgi:peptide/nickel transport system permease protein
MAWAARRIGVSLLLVWVVATVVFVAIHLVPGDPAELLLSSGGVAPDPAAVAELRERLGLDRPLLEQYAAFLSGLARGDLGASLVDDYPVAEEIMRRLPRTLELIGAGALAAVLLGAPPASALDANQVRSRVTSALSQAGSATGAYALAIAAARSSAPASTKRASRANSSCSARFVVSSSTSVRATSGVSFSNANGRAR